VKVAKIHSAVILAAGKGTRLLPLTREMPKCLLDINGRCILSHQLQSLIDCGITEIAIVVGHFSDRIAEHVRDNGYDKKANIRLIYNDAYATTASCYSLYLCKDMILDHGYVHVNSDLCFSKTSLERLLVCKEVNTILTSLSSAQDDDMVRFESDTSRRITKIGRPWQVQSPKGCLVGPMKMSTEATRIFLKAIESRFERRIVDDACYILLDSLVHKINLSYLDVGADKWFEMDTLDDLESARRNWKLDRL